MISINANANVFGYELKPTTQMFNLQYKLNRGFIYSFCYKLFIV